MMENEAEGRDPNPSAGGDGEAPPASGREGRRKVVVIMGPTGSGKSRLAVDLAGSFPIEIVNADSMQVYRGLDVLTNKVPVDQRNEVPHHLLGTVSPDVEFTAKAFRDAAMPLIEEIWSRDNLPVVVGGTNYYLQALLSSFLRDDFAADMHDGFLDERIVEENQDVESGNNEDSEVNSFDRLKDIDPVAANRIHPNNQRKISQYLDLYDRFQVIPSELFQSQKVENWGCVDSLRYDCCFICVDALLPALDEYVERRVDCMINTGLLEEVYNIYKFNADYTRGLQQAIGVREFENFLCTYLSDVGDLSSIEQYKGNIKVILDRPISDELKLLLEEAVGRMKLNTRRLVRRQRRRIRQLWALFGWKIHYVDSTEALSCGPEHSWVEQVVRPAVRIIQTFLHEKMNLVPVPEAARTSGTKLLDRDLWTLYTCQFRYLLGLWGSGTKRSARVGTTQTGPLPSQTNVQAEEILLPGFWTNAGIITYGLSTVGRGHSLVAMFC